MRTCYLCGASEETGEPLATFYEEGKKFIKGDRVYIPHDFTSLCRNHGFSFRDCFTGMPFIAYNHAPIMSPPKLRSITQVYTRMASSCLAIPGEFYERTD